MTELVLSLCLKVNACCTNVGSLKSAYGGVCTNANGRSWPIVACREEQQPTRYSRSRVYEIKGDSKSLALEWPQMSVERLSSIHSKDEHDGPHRPYLPDGYL